MPRRLAGRGISVELPERWEARLYRRPRPADGDVRELVAHAALGPLPSRITMSPVAYGWAGDRPNAILHMANFPLPAQRGDFGTGAVELMGERHGFVALVEYDGEEAHRPLFRAVGVPRVQLTDFAANALQRRLPRQLGMQRFFTEQDRPFCLYVVLGSATHARALVAEVNGALARVRIEPNAEESG